MYGSTQVNHASTQVDAIAAAARAVAYTLEQLAVSLDSPAADAGTGPDELSDRWEAVLEENRQLREALDSRGAIERAKGVLMGRYGCTEKDAFTLLATAARRQHRKVRLIAHDLLSGVHLPDVEHAACALTADVHESTGVARAVISVPVSAPISNQDDTGMGSGLDAVGTARTADLTRGAA